MLKGKFAYTGPNILNPRKKEVKLAFHLSPDDLKFPCGWRGKGQRDTVRESDGMLADVDRCRACGKILHVEYD